MRQFKRQIAFQRLNSKNLWLVIPIFLSIAKVNFPNRGNWHLVWVLCGTPFISLFIMAGLREYGRWHDLVRHELEDFHPIAQAKRRNGFLMFIGGTLLSIVVGLIVAFIVDDLNNNRFEVALSFAIFANVLSLPTLWFARRYYFIERKRLAVSMTGYTFYIFIIGISAFLWGYGLFVYLVFAFVYLFVIQWISRRYHRQLNELLAQKAYQDALNLHENMSSWRQFFILQHSFNYNRALVLIHLGRLDEAKLSLNNILHAKYNIRIPPNFYLYILNQLALVYLGVTLYSQAQAYLQAAITLNKRLHMFHPAMHDNLALTYLLQDKSPEFALQYFDKAIAEAEASRQKFFLPQIFLAKAGRAWALAKLGKFDEANQALPQNVQDFAHNIPVYTNYVYRLGQTYLAQGKIELAREQFELASKADENGFIGNQVREILTQIEEPH